MEDIIITAFQERYKADFIKLNTAWISRYFKLEEEDRKSFSQVEKIIENGGYIFFALLGSIAVGTCALKKQSQTEYELCKFAVDERWQGYGIGKKLLETVLNKAKELKANRVYLEGNTRLKSSIHLYRLFGFKEVDNFKSSYDRVDIVMQKLFPEV